MTTKADQTIIDQLLGDPPTMHTEPPAHDDATLRGTGSAADEATPVPPFEHLLPRWAELDLADPRRDGRLPTEGSTADLAMYGLVLPGSSDPIEGGVAAVMEEQRAMATLCGGWARRLESLMCMLRRADGRERRPVSPAERVAEERPRAATTPEPAV